MVGISALKCMSISWCSYENWHLYFIVRGSICIPIGLRNLYLESNCNTWNRSLKFCLLFPSRFFHTLRQPRKSIPFPRNTPDSKQYSTQTVYLSPFHMQNSEEPIFSARIHSSRVQFPLIYGGIMSILRRVSVSEGESIPGIWISRRMPLLYLIFYWEWENNILLTILFLLFKDTWREIFMEICLYFEHPQYVEFELK